jgi:hypothetical protein
VIVEGIVKWMAKGMKDLKDLKDLKDVRDAGWHAIAGVPCVL